LQRAGSASTKRYVAISHPGRDLQGLECGESSMFATCEQIPHDGGLANIVADDESPGPSLAHIIYRNELDVITVMRESSLDCKSVVVQTNYDGSL
jgi:hypothetical protein